MSEDTNFQRLIAEHEEILKDAVEQAYSAIGKHSLLMNPSINYESLEGALRVAIDQLEEIRAILEAKELGDAIRN